MSTAGCFAAMTGLAMSVFLIEQDGIEAGFVHTQAVGVLNEAELLEPIHEETHPRPRGTDHFGQRFLTDFGNDRYRLTGFLERSQEQQRPRQPLLGRIKELIDQVLLNAKGARQEMGHKQFGERRLVVKHIDHRLFVDAHDTGMAHSSRRSHVQELPREAPFPEKITLIQDRDHGFFPLPGHDRELNLACLDIEHGSGRIPLRKKHLVFLALQSRSTVAGLRQKGPGIEWPGFCAWDGHCSRRSLG